MKFKITPPEMYECTRCGYQWVQRRIDHHSKSGKLIGYEYAKFPKICAKCKSPYWFKEKVLFPKKKRD